MTVLYYNNYVDTTNFSDTDAYGALTANTVETYTVPGTATQVYQALFSFNADSNVFVGYNSTPAVPANNTITTTGRVEFKPWKRIVNGGDVLSFVTPDAVAYFGLSLRYLPSSSN